MHLLKTVQLLAFVNLPKWHNAELRGRKPQLAQPIRNQNIRSDSPYQVVKLRVTALENQLLMPAGYSEQLPFR